MSWNILRLSVPVEFPAGAAPGAGRDRNASFIARDGRGAPVLRGSALSGALRRAWRRAVNRSEADAQHWFGHASDSATRTGVASRIAVHDVALIGSGRGTDTRTHNAIDRHTGAPVDKGLFTVESILPGTTGTVLLVLRAASEELAEATELLREIYGVLRQGMHVGGSTARGVGLMKARAAGGAFRHFDLSKLDDHAAWLDEQHARAELLRSGRFEGTSLEPIAAQNQLVLTVQLGIPRGQDVLIGGDSGLDARIEPQKVAAADGSMRLRFPGSSFRGVMRKWVVRLAAREGLAVADNHGLATARQQSRTAVTGDELANGFANTARRAELAQNPALVECPVMRLFGSAFAKGRFHVSDALVPLPADQLQRRTHVSIDRFGGGASNGFLFDTMVVASGKETACVPLRIEVDAPTQQEAKWIADTLRAIDLGVLRVGSSKGAGRFEVKSMKAEGPHAEMFAQVCAKGDTNRG
jgi:CRISPR/Cas system CSM-associated protein Csm3 (group 7 of RAMP superfamily)